MTPQAFLEMAKTSTQVKRAIKLIGLGDIEELIIDLASKHVDSDGQVDVKYHTKLYLAKN